MNIELYRHYPNDAIDDKFCNEDNEHLKHEEII